MAFLNCSLNPGWIALALAVAVAAAGGGAAPRAGSGGAVTLAESSIHTQIRELEARSQAATSDASRYGIQKQASTVPYP